MIVSTSVNRGEAAARRRGWTPGIDCLIVHDIDSLLLTCLEDWTENTFIQDDPLGLSQDFRKAIMKYCDLLEAEPSQGFGWRNMLDNDPDL